MNEGIHSKAEADYLLGMKYKDIAAKYNVTINTVKSWKQRNGWNRKGVHTKSKSRHTKKMISDKDSSKPNKGVVVSEDLTDKQRLFCIYYLKSFNATQAMIKAGYAADSAHVEGHRLLRKPKVAEYIRDLKQDMANNVFVEAMDVLNVYIKIAFTDITEFLVFGQKEVPVMGMFGPVKNEDGTPAMQTVNYVDFKDSSAIDGTLISEIKQGKEGVSIKLADKMKALDKLAEYFDLFPDKFKRQIEEEKQKMAREKLDLEKLKASEGDDPVEDDGFIEALKGQVSEVWDDDDTEEN